MRIVRYNNEYAQKQLGSKTKPEPWLHACITDANGESKESMYAIYIWDTRQIVETGKCKPGVCAYAKRALDNHTPLVGEHADMFDFSKHSFVLKKGDYCWGDQQGVQELIDGTSPYCDRLCILAQYTSRYAEGIGGTHNHAILYVGPKGEGFMKRSEMSALLRRLSSEKAKKNRNNAKLEHKNAGAGVPGMSWLDYDVMTLRQAMSANRDLFSTPVISYDVN